MFYVRWKDLFPLDSLVKCPDIFLDFKLFVLKQRKREKKMQFGLESMEHTRFKLSSSKTILKSLNKRNKLVIMEKVLDNQLFV